MYSYKTNTPIRFDGDIIITDPCYIVKKQDMSTSPKWEDFMDRPSYAGMSHKELVECGFFERQKKMDAAEEEWRKLHPDDWEICEYGEKMENLGLSTFLSASTIYGDWGCTTFNSDTKEIIGEFCADSGRVGVFLLEEVLKYNPNFDYHINRPWTTTFIKDFHGTVELHLNRKNNDRFNSDVNMVDDEVEVIGKGNINFIGTQTEL